MYQYFRKKIENTRSGEPNPGLFNAHSPYNKFINDIENKRSRLFPDRRRVPGRKFKFLFTISYIIHFYSMAKIAHIKSQAVIKEENMRKMQRKVVPYFESLEDIEYATVKHRNDLILGEIFKDKGGMEFVKNWKRFHNEIAWSQSFTLGKFVLAGTGRNEYTVMQSAFGRVVSGLVDKNA